MLDPVQATFVCTDSNSNDAKAAGSTSFFNPMYSQNGKVDYTKVMQVRVKRYTSCLVAVTNQCLSLQEPYLDASITQAGIHFNPLQAEEGAEADSTI